MGSTYCTAHACTLHGHTIPCIKHHASLYQNSDHHSCTNSDTIIHEDDILISHREMCVWVYTPHGRALYIHLFLGCPNFLAARMQRGKSPTEATGMQRRRYSSRVTHPTGGRQYRIMINCSCCCQSIASTKPLRISLLLLPSYLR